MPGAADCLSFMARSDVFCLSHLEALSSPGQHRGRVPETLSQTYTLHLRLCWERFSKQTRFSDAHI